MAFHLTVAQDLAALVTTSQVRSAPQETWNVGLWMRLIPKIGNFHGLDYRKLPVGAFDDGQGPQEANWWGIAELSQ
jgi:hypothetical protein